MAMRSESNSPLKKFFEENKSLKFLLPLLLLLVIAVIIVNFVLGRDAADTTSGNPPGITDPAALEKQQKVEVLPQIIRSGSSGEVDVNKDPFADPMKLVGVVYSETKPTAIINWGNYSYIVGLDDIVGDSKWQVTGIGKDNITLDSGNEKMTLHLDGSF